MPAVAIGVGLGAGLIFLTLVSMGLWLFCRRRGKTPLYKESTGNPINEASHWRGEISPFVLSDSRKWLLAELDAPLPSPTAKSMFTQSLPAMSLDNNTKCKRGKANTITQLPWIPPELPP
jgi:hypothetical protein